jgi:hypothetical protein
MTSSAQQPEQQKTWNMPLIKISQPRPEGVNDKCHTWTGSLNPHNQEILTPPRVLVVYWM